MTDEKQPLQPHEVHASVLTTMPDVLKTLQAILSLFGQLLDQGKTPSAAPKQEPPK